MMFDKRKHHCTNRAPGNLNSSLKTSLCFTGSFRTSIMTFYWIWNKKLNNDIHLEERDFQPPWETMWSMVGWWMYVESKGPLLLTIGLSLGGQTHGAVKSRSKWLTQVQMKEYSNGMKIINIHETSGCFHKGSGGYSYLAIIRGKRSESE